MRQWNESYNKLAFTINKLKYMEYINEYIK